MAKKLRIGIYARVSTDQQEVDTQLRDLREFVANRKWPKAKEFVDVGISGKKEKRPAWNDLWDAIQKNKVDIVVVHALDRLGRSLSHLVKIIDTLVAKEIAFVSYRENLDLTTSTGRLIANIIATLADYELSMIRERTKAGLRRAKAEGKQIGNKRNYFDKRKAAKLRDEGWGQVRIAKELSVGVGTLRNFLATEYVPNQQES